jgi:hypothetical protein
VGLLTVATFSRDDLVDALDQLVDELVAASVSARIRVVGGAALVLVHDENRGSTRDVDSLGVDPAEAVMAAAARVAARNDWPQTWINTDALMYAPDPDHPEPAWEVFLNRDGVVIEVATAEFLLAMKLHAARGRRDTDDFDVLVERCGIAGVNEAVELFDAHYRAEVLSVRALAKLRAIFGEAEPRLPDQD